MTDAIINSAVVGEWLARARSVRTVAEYLRAISRSGPPFVEACTALDRAAAEIERAADAVA